MDHHILYDHTTKFKMTVRVLLKKFIGSRKRLVISLILAVIFMDLCILSAPRRHRRDTSEAPPAAGADAHAELGPEVQQRLPPVHPRQRRQNSWDSDLSPKQEQERQKELDQELGRGAPEQERDQAGWQPKLTVEDNPDKWAGMNEVGVDQVPEKPAGQGWAVPGAAALPRRTQRQPALPRQRLEVEAGEERVNVTLDGLPLLVMDPNGRSRGLHVVVLHQTSGAVMARRRFDTVLSEVHQEAVRFLDAVRSGRIIVLATKDDMSFKMHSELRFRLTQLGSQFIPNIGFRDQWAMVAIQGSGEALGETFSPAPADQEFGGPLFLRVDLQLGALPETPPCQWPDSEENQRRHAFCDYYEGYPGLCRCLQPHPILPEPSSLEENIDSIYVAVMATHRPYYLYRSLRSLTFAQGAQPTNVVVYLENDLNPELEALVSLFGFKVRYVTPEKNEKIAMVISKRVIEIMDDVFTTFMEAEYVFFLEEDLECSPDIFRYFGQTYRLLREDPTLFSVSAFNLQSRTNTSTAVDVAYRVDNFGGVGFLLNRQTFEKDIKPVWPKYAGKSDWDIFIDQKVLNGRENLWPDVNRLYHIGRDSHYVNTDLFDGQYKNLSVNPDPTSRLRDVSRLYTEPYEEDLKTTLKEGIVISNYTSMCDVSNFTFNLQKQNKTEIIYFKLENVKDLTTWSTLAKCWGLWPHTTDGHHRGLWRFWLTNKKGFHYHIILIGVPFSQYSSFKPADVVPYQAPHLITSPTPSSSAAAARPPASSSSSAAPPEQQQPALPQPAAPSPSAAAPSPFAATPSPSAATPSPAAAPFSPVNGDSVSAASPIKAVAR